MPRQIISLPHARRYREDGLQVACRRWFDYQYPHLRLLLHHSPNEGLLPRTARDGAKRKDMGVRAGFPDFILCVRNRFYGFLCIELKSSTGRQTVSQREFQNAVTSLGGGLYTVVRSLDEFRAVILSYLSNIPT